MTKRKPKKKGKKTKPDDTSVCTYKIGSPRQYNSYDYRKFQPSEAGCFGIDDNGDIFTCTSRGFPVYKDTIHLPLDLNVGMEDYNKSEGDTPTTGPLWHQFLRWVVTSQFDVGSVDVVARRGVLKYIGHTLYNTYNTPWCFRLCRYQGVLYLHEPGLGTRSYTSVSEWHERAMYWGRCFERSVVGDSAGVRGCYRMVRGRVGKYRVLLGAEVDAVRHPDQSGVKGCQSGVKECSNTNCETDNTCTICHKHSSEFIEIKTCAKRKLRDRISFGWLQSYLAGIDTLIFGYRDGEGIVRETQEFPVCGIPGRYHDSWDAGAMFGLISGVLNWASQIIGEGEVGSMLYLGEKEIIVSKEPGQAVFLPEWYLKHLDFGK